MKYFKLFNALFRHSVKRYLENRLSTAGHMSLMLLNFFLQIYVVQILFIHTSSIAGWSREEVFLILGLYRLFSTLFSLFFQRSINHSVGEIAEGNLDLVLTKPFSSQFYYTFFLLRPFEIINLLAPIGLLSYALPFFPQTYSLPHLISLLVLLICGLIIFYSIYITLASITFWVGKFSSFPSLYNVFSFPLSFPVDIYGQNTNFILTFILPFAFVITIPAKVFLGKLDFFYVILGITFAVTSLFLSIKSWNIALRHYSSASS